MYKYIAPSTDMKILCGTNENNYDTSSGVRIHLMHVMFV